jgi:phosphoenolpyruvate carboxykinase (ATP)
VPGEILNPRGTWKFPGAYDQAAGKLAAMFNKNFQENAPDAPAEIKAGGPV